MPKKTERDPLRFFNIQFVAKIKNLSLKSKNLLQSRKNQFGTIKFRKTFKNYFGQFVWIEKKVPSKAT